MINGMVATCVAHARKFSSCNCYSQGLATMLTATCNTLARSNDGTVLASQLASKTFRWQVRQIASSPYLICKRRYQSVVHKRAHIFTCPKLRARCAVATLVAPRCLMVRDGKILFAGFAATDCTLMSLCMH